MFVDRLSSGCDVPGGGVSSGLREVVFVKSPDSSLSSFLYRKKIISAKMIISVNMNERTFIFTLHFVTSVCLLCILALSVIFSCCREFTRITIVLLVVSPNDG